MAKARADFLHCSGVPNHLHRDWYQQGTGTTEWAWLLHLSPWTNTQYGFPPVEGNALPFLEAKMPCMHTLAEYITPTNQQDTTIQRDIALTLASYNIGAVAEKSYNNGVTAFTAKAYMLAEGFRKEKLLIVGLQESRSKEGGTSQIL